ncbi:MAG TPA: hypothetical protein VMT03_10040 [Polyangia bacterium]|nr:hypothetical protein [Polyangia bacterium]
MRWAALLAALIGLLIVVASCEVDVPLGVAPFSDAAVDAGTVD